ncbi:putative quinone oxidoreductase [Kalaharituber pfeilii]|nr:putative quinone oxidoreductase [Kalaharituber pfeilii]
MATPSTELPATHAAILLHNPGPSNSAVLTSNLPLPALAPGQILVRNTYSGVNYIDNYIPEGYIVAASPDVTSSTDSSISSLSPGTRVAYLANQSYAQYTAVPVSNVIALPDTLEPGLGAAVLLQGLTVITLARESYAAKKGDIVLVHAAAGGVGLLLTQYLTKVIGARVIATASSAEKLALARGAGAEWRINYTDPSPSTTWESAVLSIPEVAAQGGVHGVYDSVGQSTLHGSLEVLRVGGTFVSFGNASGAIEGVKFAWLTPKNLKVLRPSMLGYVSRREDFLKYAQELVELVVKGTLKVKMHKTYDWKEIDQAHKDISSRGTTGKLLLEIN